jgi:hypothetical protein
MLRDCPEVMLPGSLKVSPLTGETVWVAVPLFVNVTVPPALMVTVAGVKEKSLISTLAARPGVGVAVGEAVGLALAEGLALGLADADGLAEAEAEGEGELEAGALAEPVGLALGDAEGLALALAEGVGDAPCGAGVEDALGFVDALVEGAVPVLGHPVSASAPTTNQKPALRISPAPASR